MLIIFGWGRQTRKKIGPVLKHQCSNCLNEEYWELEKITVWFTLFLIPVFPYEYKYYLLCPACNYGLRLTQKEFNDFRPLAELNAAYRSGSINQHQYEISAAAIPHSDEHYKPALNPSISITNPNRNMYCHHCGMSLPEGAKYCPQCRAEVKTLSPVPQQPKVTVMSALSTGEDVSLEEVPARFLYRAGAFIADYLIFLTLIFGVGFVLGILGLKGVYENENAATLVAIVVWYFYHFVSLSTTSTTLGKKLFGLRVVREKEGTNITTLQALGRPLGYILSLSLAGFGFWKILWNKKNQTLHDELAHTTVLRKRSTNTAWAILATIGIGLIVAIGYAKISELNNATDSSTNIDTQQVQGTNTPPVQTEETTQQPNPEDYVNLADYEEGYKAGYADGRTYSGKLGDNYNPPATEERRTPYALGYLDGFLKGCKEGNYDCTSLEQSLKDDLQTTPDQTNAY